jgi:tRNA uridine 5-carboxymethylaminomethyl modification enzyme
LFFAGQINGTTGYEEAGAQGLLAGINAARKCQNKKPWEPGRDEAYIGVLVDDLINFGTTEPYRMFTSRAEFRLRLRQDNADQRLTPMGIEFGLIGASRRTHFEEKMKRVEEFRRQFKTVCIRPGSDLDINLGLSLNKETTLEEALRRPEINSAKVSYALKIESLDAAGDDAADAAALRQLEVEIKYAGYIKRQDDEILKIRRHERMLLPTNMDFSNLDGLSNELKQKLEHHQPESLARAARIPGMTPAALSILLIHAKAHGKVAATAVKS